MPFAGAFDLKVSNGALGVYGGKTIAVSAVVRTVELLFLRKVTWSPVSGGFAIAVEAHKPTLDVASVKLFNVVLLPLEGLPTSPIKGSRGILACVNGIGS